MYQAIVFLPLLGTIIAALITITGAHARHPGATPAAGAEDHAKGPVDETHARVAPSPDEPHAAIAPSAGEPQPHDPPASGSRLAEIVPTTTSITPVRASMRRAHSTLRSPDMIHGRTAMRVS